MTAPDTILYLFLVVIGMILFLVLLYYNMIPLFRNPRIQKPIMGETWKATYDDGSEDEILSYEPYFGKTILYTSRHPKGRLYRDWIDLRPRTMLPYNGLFVVEVSKTSDGNIYKEGIVHRNLHPRGQEVAIWKEMQIKNMVESNKVERDKRINQSPQETLQFDRATNFVKSSYDFMSKLGQQYFTKKGGDKLGNAKSGVGNDTGTETNNFDSK